MLNNPKVRAVAGSVIDGPARGLLRLHVSPDAVTLAGTLGVVIASVAFLAHGRWLAGFLVALLFAPCDMLDGAMARMSGRSGPWGAYLDSTLDRVGDGAVFAAFAYWYASTQDLPTVVAALLALVGSLLVSYARARAEGLGATCAVGIAERTERLVVLAVGVLFAIFGLPQVLPWALWLVAALTAITFVQRVLHVRGQLHPSVVGAGEAQA